MRCPKCSSADSKVVDTRAGKNESSIRRRRECLNCSHRFSTVEEILKEDFAVKKRDGRREEYDRSKIAKGISKALEKRPVTVNQIEDMVHQVTVNLQNKYDNEVPSNAIGEEIMNQLKTLDQIAYVRFASVYKDFHDISQLAHEIKSLNANNSSS